MPKLVIWICAIALAFSTVVVLAKEQPAELIITTVS